MRRNPKYLAKRTFPFFFFYAPQNLKQAPAYDSGTFGTPFTLVGVTFCCLLLGPGSIKALFVSSGKKKHAFSPFLPFSKHLAHISASHIQVYTTQKFHLCPGVVPSLSNMSASLRIEEDQWGFCLVLSPIRLFSSHSKHIFCSLSSPYC